MQNLSKIHFFTPQNFRPTTDKKAIFQKPLVKYLLNLDKKCKNNFHENQVCIILALLLYTLFY